jgi:hypothetical protein
MSTDLLRTRGEEVVGVSVATQPPTNTDKDNLIGAEIAFGATAIGRVQGVIRDPLSQRVRRLITTYGSTGRRVAVPMEWVTKRTPARLELGVGPRSLDDLPERVDVVRTPSPPISSPRKEDPTV